MKIRRLETYLLNEERLESYQLNEDTYARDLPAQ
jgi:hypothetical protein